LYFCTALTAMVISANTQNPPPWIVTRLYWRFYRNMVASDLDHWLPCCDRTSNTISMYSTFFENRLILLITYTLCRSVMKSTA
jgi:hypothetical protein